jgi:tRNA nucleotidyltransferase (CCA-adding enzyme)
MQDFDWLMTSSPGAALRHMHASGVLARDLPEVHYLYGVPQRAEHHPEVDTGAHIELCLDAAAALGLSPAGRFAVLVHDLGKGITDPAKWPAHVDHETTGVPLVEQVCERFGVPAHWREVALQVCELHLKAHTALSLRIQTVLRLVDVTGMAHDAAKREDFLGACEADARGRLGRHDAPYPQGQYLREAAQVVANLPHPDQEPRDSLAWQHLHRARLLAVQAVRTRYLVASTAQPDVCA